MIEKELKEKLFQSKSKAELKDLLAGYSSMDVDRIYEEVSRHRSDRSEKLDLDELDAVSGGADRHWPQDGCAATCEYSSWCWNNDWCRIFDVTYDHFYFTCPDGHEHVLVDRHCIRCNYYENDVNHR